MFHLCLSHKFTKELLESLTDPRSVTQPTPDLHQSTTPARQWGYHLETKIPQIKFNTPGTRVGPGFPERALAKKADIIYIFLHIPSKDREEIKKEEN